ncbi:MAG TPA: hypothetical protein PLV68_20265, partial [Ilumatobacteraceae bacterium]|nr:hypothetical protein [Ilumatobacteraceae bacterium]
LVARDPSQPEARRLPNVRQVWNAISAAVGSGIEPRAPLDTAIADFEAYSNHFLAGTVQVYNELDVAPVAAADNPDGLDVTSLNVSSTLVLMASIAPSAMITPFDTLNFRIENGLTQADIDAAGLVGVTNAD